MTRVDGSSTARWIGSVVMVGALLAGGCSSSSEDTTTDSGPDTTSAAGSDEPSSSASQPPATDADGGRSPGEVTLIDAGSEPRVALQITTDARSRIAVDASEALDTTIDGVTTSGASEASYELDIDLQVGSDGVEMLVVPTMVSFDGSMPDPDELGSWRWFLDPHGVVQRVVPIGRGESVDEGLLRLLNVSNLVLTTPTEPVGPGASWSQSLNRQSDAQLVFDLIGVSDTELEVAIELIAPFDTGTATMSVSGTYDRATLLATDASADAGLEVTSPVTDNGELVELTGVQRSRRTYAEVGE
jgi:hypothetical protein